MPAETYLRTILTPLLSEPDALVIHSSNDELGVLITLTVHKYDMGVVIGKKGETANAVRHLVRVVGAKNDARVSVKITEPDGTFHQRKNKTLDEVI